VKIRIVVETDQPDSQELPFQQEQVGRLAASIGAVAGTMLPGTVRIWTEELDRPVIDGGKWTKGVEIYVL
jgi:hypothetical protein